MLLFYLLHLLFFLQIIENTYPLCCKLCSSFRFFPPLPAVVAANVTNVVLKDYLGPVECVVMLIVSPQHDWK